MMDDKKMKFLLGVLFCYIELFSFTLGHPIHGLLQKNKSMTHVTKLRAKRQIVNFNALPDRRCPSNLKSNQTIPYGKKLSLEALKRGRMLPAYDFKKFHMVGTVMHEIGHTLGLYHEMQRLDRDKYLKLSLGDLDANVNYRYPDTDTKNDGLPFDLGSIMEYSAWVPSDKNDLYSISMLPKKHRKIFVMGQEVEIGFFDAKLINIEYCPNTSREKLPCKHDGYPDPLAPGRCRCLPEWSGRYCQLTSPSSRGCSPYIGHHRHTIFDVGKEFSLYTPNYLNNNHHWSFSSGDQCFWYIQVPPKYQIAWWIDTTHDNSGTGVYLGMYLKNTACQAWVEIRKGAETRGQRICGLFDSENHLTNGSRPVLSHSHKLHISFLSFALFKQTLPALIRRGFFLKYTFVSKQLKYKTNIPLIDEVKYVLDSWGRLDPRS